MVKAAPASLPRVSDITLDWHVLVFTFVVSLLSDVLFGLVPISKLARINLNETLKKSGRGASGGIRRHKTRSTLVVVEVAL